MPDENPDTRFDVAMRLLINVAAVGLFVGLIAIVVATIIHEAG